MKKHLKLTPEFLYIDFLIHPLPLFCVLMTFLNDHWLKYRFPGALTGKISDFSGLFYFPLFLCAIYVFIRRYVFRRLALVFLQRNILILSILVTAVFFVLVKICVPATDFYLQRLSDLGIKAQVTRDFTDLVALSALLVSYWHGRRFTEL